MKAAATEVIIESDSVVAVESATAKQELISIEQLPIIKERLKVISEDIDAKIEAALSLECTEETVKKIKAVRAELNKNFLELEERRKAVKTAIMTPYERFEEIYKKYVSSKFRNADSDLRDRINQVENDIKNQKKLEVVFYFDE